ncbi:copper resistance CopC family protein [Ureibacillus sp. MALMAid1270]|uniref:copper resistance CopC family protein n=1 Tax=Ureibacillus sp. MALMAid1270 TaxID=3411629 RepID=UPI003BA62DCC
MLKVKKSLLMSLIVLLLFSLFPISMANAHSVLENSIPADGEQVNDSINRIELSFNTKIENGSTLTLVNDVGDELNPSSYEINDNVLVAIFEDSLESGTYQVNWKVIGADDHHIENQYSFTITVPGMTEDENETTQTEEETNSTSEKETSTTDEVNNQEEENQHQSSSNENEQSSLVMIIIICLIIAVIGIVAWMLFSNRKK